MTPKGMSDFAGMAEEEEIPYFDITDAPHSTCHMIFYRLKTIVHQSSEDAFAVNRWMSSSSWTHAWSMARGGGGKWDGASGAK